MAVPALPPGTMRAIHNPVASGLNYRGLSRDSSPMRPDRTYYVYILAIEPNGTLYIGVTNNLSRRMSEHREGLVEGFTKKYAAKTLVYFETFTTAADAIHREKRMKKYPRAWKVNPILSHNPGWQDLTEGLI